MKSFSLFAAICAVALSAGATKTANALDLDFFFKGGPGDPPGIVSGEIDGLPNNGVGPASAVFLNSWPSAVGNVCSLRPPPVCNLLAFPWGNQTNFFMVSSGQVVKANFTSVSFGGLELSLGVGEGETLLHGQNNNITAVPIYNVVFGPCRRPAVICEQIGITRVCRHGFRPCP